ncbi:MAG: gamma carbonic anhydrase family protein [Elusimicrobia bacterium]|nr:gamma carbonic anhydrase family protein [Elusimicrobiota bacterium]MDE2237158.1 gamma carbonic anhydrase family protein [Elusimicrobiota bacterium]MDE2424901.1 gamma carbonic anhydrase family protein [Elusimicrobiota bacterium]
MIRSFEKRRPRLHATAFVHDSAEVIGDVVVGREASIWTHAVLRGDVDGIRVGAGTNLQDCVVVHCRAGRPAVIGRGVTVGHSAIIHGSVIGDYCLIGMGAVVMEARLGRECVVAAGALVPKGFSAPARSLILGLPAKLARPLSAAEVRSLHESAEGYVRLAGRHRRGSRILL